MPTTRLQSTKVTTTPKIKETGKPSTTTTKRARKGTTTRAAGSKRKAKNGVKADDEDNDLKKDQKEQAGTEEQAQGGVKPEEEDQPPAKKRRGRTGPRRREVDVVYKEGVIERGHVYFFYRPKVQLVEVESPDDVTNLHMVLVPRPPIWLESAALSSQQEGGTVEKKEDVGPDIKVLLPGADVVPAPQPKDTSKTHYRVITIGKKQLPTLELMAKTTQRGRRHPVFWGTVTAVGDDLEELKRGMEEKTYETKTRGMRHMEPARLVARGVYAIVNRESPRVPSEQESHLAYRVSHPPPEDIGEVQHAFGILDAAAFVIQTKNPLAPPITPRQRSSNRAQYPEELMRAVFGAGTGVKGRSDYGLRFAPCETSELLDYKGAEVLFITAREGQSGIEESIGEERGLALKVADEQDEKEAIEDIYKELSLDIEKFPTKTLKGEWI